MLALLFHLFLSPAVATEAQCPKLLKELQDQSWLPTPNRVQWFLDSSHLPDPAVTTAAYVLVVQNGRILVARHRTRGWDILGGHVDAGESASAAAAREAFEEARVHLGPLALLGHQKLELLGPRPANYKYPHPVSYQVFFAATAQSLDPFQEEEDMVERQWMTWQEAEQKVAWVRNHPEYVARVRALFP